MELKHNYKSKDSNLNYEAKYAFLILGALIMALIPELALADATFDIDKGVKAATDPFIKGIKEHWGKGLLLTGGTTAVIGEGDLRQRAMRAGIGCTVGGAVILGIIAALG